MADIALADVRLYRTFGARSVHPRDLHVWLQTDGEAVRSAVLYCRRRPVLGRGCRVRCKFATLLYHNIFSRFPDQGLDTSAFHVLDCVRGRPRKGSISLTEHDGLQTRFPESVRPGTFDIYGSSHQIFHILVVMATAVHLAGVLEAIEYNYYNRQCPSR